MRFALPSWACAALYVFPSPPPARASHVANPRAGHPKTGWGKTNRFTCILGINMKQYIAMQMRFPYCALTSQDLAGDPPARGSPEHWLGQTNYFTCILGLDMKWCFAMQYVSRIARSPHKTSRVTHPRAGHPKIAGGKQQLLHLHSGP